MHTEFEITFRDIDHAFIREKIKALGGECIQERTLMKRIVYLAPENPENSYFRLRDEGNKQTFTYKYISPTLDIHAVKEIETEVKDFHAMQEMLALAGLKSKSFQEMYREVWKIHSAIYFMLDEWPGLKPFIEIEGESEDIVREYTEALGFEWDMGVFGAIDELYLQELGISKQEINFLPEITFQNPPRKIS